MCAARNQHVSLSCNIVFSLHGQTHSVSVDKPTLYPSPGLVLRVRFANAKKEIITRASLPVLWIRRFLSAATMKSHFSSLAFLVRAHDEPICFCCTAVWIPLEDHPLKLERYRED